MAVRIDVSEDKGLVQYKAEKPVGTLMAVSGTITTNGSVVANQDQTKIVHKPTITPAIAESAPGLGPQPISFGSVMGLEYDTPATDAAYRVMKIDNTFVDQGNPLDASFHVHWTKSGDTDESGNGCTWVLSYTVFNGETEDINVTPTVITMSDTYTDSGTTSKIVHRTTNFEAPGFVANYYIGVKLEVTGSTLSSNPVLISCDMLFRNYINN